MAFPAILRAQAGTTPNNRLNVALVGVGGRGRAAVAGMKGENIVAFCDVDDDRASQTYKEFPDVPQFRDYRRMLDQLGNRIDAVTISTPDHMHFPIAMAAMSLGKHVFVEKPMAHTVAETRLMAKMAREKKIASAMGNQGHAGDGVRLLREWFQAGVLGEVREVHCWSNRPIWPQGMTEPDHSKLIPRVPTTLDWDLWLGVAQPREYDPAYLPFNWRGYWDFGTGALGDMGCHTIDGAYWALELTQPTSLTASSAHQTDESGPTASMVVYDFPARGSLPPVKLTWYDGGLQPPFPVDFEVGREFPTNGAFIIGSKATVMAGSHYQTVRIVPEKKMRELTASLPGKTIPRIPDGHFAEWIGACKGGTPAGSNFDYASQLTETVLLSCVAIRAGRRLEWDSSALKVTNLPQANRYLTKEYRSGFGV